jgi:hypothetical protein
MRTTGVATHVGLVSVSSTRGGARALPPRPPRALRCNAGGTKPDVSLTVRARTRIDSTHVTRRMHRCVRWLPGWST